jgi:hypothetical protein
MSQSKLRDKKHHNLTVQERAQLLADLTTLADKKVVIVKGVSCSSQADIAKVYHVSAATLLLLFSLLISLAFLLLLVCDFCQWKDKSDYEKHLIEEAAAKDKSKSKNKYGRIRVQVEF